eukprot:CAMPEP_0197029124 /NCGR_PEP_ID=MMETSP1384-20130603/8634_1 /TAXON_ID=29189 /ORGANISM="Ammonia sp." /LENGTH=252 /DNA_ID=CAMNT_0042458229 /DNA_START=555 /DNA_END=1310 /DNA_ORIENTATION=-
MAELKKEETDSNTKQTNKSMEQRKYPQRIQEVFNYLDANPMSIVGQKMYYKPAQQLSNTKRDLVHLYEKLETLDFDTSNTSSQHHAQVTRALLYLSLNGIDECHNLVTPYSWPSYTSFGGAPVFNSAASQNACYAHAFTHRREGQNVGEFGTGWNNSNYWFGQTGRHQVVFPLIAKYAYDIVYDQEKKESTYQAHKQITKFLQSILKMDHQNKQQFQLQWDAYKFNNLCELAVKQRDKTLMAFCEDVWNQEW